MADRIKDSENNPNAFEFKIGSFTRTQRADHDIEKIVSYISSKNPNAALSWLENIEAKFEAIGITPSMGVSRPDVRPELRSFSFGNYLILYRKVGGGAEIIRVVHGARDWQKSF
jgi:toxin ParE1/3/4